MDGKSRNIVFFSNFCLHSRHLLNEIIKHNLRDMFVLVCIDNNRVNIPPSINRVPVIFDPQTKRLLSDDEAFQTIADLSTVNQSVIHAYGSAANKFTEGYSYLSGEHSGEDDERSPYFSDNHIVTPPDSERSRSGQTEPSLNLDKLRAQRAADMNVIHSSMPRPIG